MTAGHAVALMLLIIFGCLTLMYLLDAIEQRRPWLTLGFGLWFCIVLDWVITWLVEVGAPLIGRP